MSDKNDPEENRNEKTESSEKQSKERNAANSPIRPPRAAVIWLVILLGLGALLLFRDFGPSRKTELNQTEFEQALSAGKIVSAVLVS